MPARHSWCCHPQNRIIPGAKHFPQEDNPETVVAAIGDRWGSEVQEKPAALVEWVS